MTLSLSKKSKIISYMILGLATVIGLTAFLHPFFLKSPQGSSAFGGEHQGDAPLLFLALILLLLAVFFGEFAGKRMNSKVVAILGVIVAVGAILRIFPLPLGASAVFLTIIIAGYCFGASFGFLTGSLTIFVSSFLSGGFGPWVPFQMLVSGWVGATAGFIPKIDKLPTREAETTTKRGYKTKKWVQIGLLCLFGIFWGYAFGALMNLWFWPYISGQGRAYFVPGTSVGELVNRYVIFYFSTSFVWDSARAVGNFLLLLFLGPPLIRIFNRFKKHVSIEII